MKSLINVLLVVALGVCAFVNIKQHNEIVGAYEEHYQFQREAGFVFYYFHKRIEALEGGSETTGPKAEQSIVPLPTPNPPSI